MSIASGRWPAPTQNVEAPEIVVTVGKPEPPLQLMMTSAARPPQPVAMRWSARPVCQQSIWSECEKSEYGVGLSSMFACVTGSTSGPTFETTPSLLWL